MKKLCLVTYTRKNECYTQAIDLIAQKLNEDFMGDFKVVICCEEMIHVPQSNYEIDIFLKKGTKYRKLISLMENDDSLYYLSIDNDISGNVPAIRQFVKKIMSQRVDIGWGRIYVDSPHGLISNLVGVDKLLSHNLIRPTVWRLGVGISVPGQIFCIKGGRFRGNLINLDTFLDDLALGLYVNVNNCKKYIVNKNLGYERPNNHFWGLWNQRKRWAIGYGSILKGVFGINKYRWKVIIHGLGYHFSWILNWAIAGLLLVKFFPICILYLIFLSIIIVGKNLKMLPYAFLYQFIFPLFHVVWMISLVRFLSKGDSNEYYS